MGRQVQAAPAFTRRLELRLAIRMQPEACALVPLDRGTASPLTTARDRSLNPV
jgi:hypothetical protein